MNSRTEFLYWHAMGLLLGAISALQFVATAKAYMIPNWLERYQTLIGAVFAVLAAVLTVASTLWVAEERRRQRLQSARALLPFALTSLIRYCRETIHDLLAVLPVRETEFSGDALRGAFVAAPLPEQAFANIAIIIELGSSEISQELSELLSRAQRFAARLEEVDSSSRTKFADQVTPHDVRCKIVDHLDLFARTQRYFDYARFRSDVIPTGPVTKFEMANVAHQSKIFENSAEIYKLIEMHVAYERTMKKILVHSGQDIHVISSSSAP